MDVIQSGNYKFVITDIYNQSDNKPGWISLSFDIPINSFLIIDEATLSTITVKYTEINKYDEILILTENNYYIFEIENYTINGDYCTIDISSLNLLEIPLQVALLTVKQDIELHNVINSGGNKLIEIKCEFTDIPLFCKDDKIILYHSTNGFIKYTIDTFNYQILDDEYVLFTFDITSLGLSYDPQSAYLVMYKYHISCNQEKNKANSSDIILEVDKDKSTSIMLVTQKRRIDDISLKTILNTDKIDTNKQLNVEVDYVDIDQYILDRRIVVFPIYGNYPKSRYGHSSTKIGNYIYYIGGYDIYDYFNDCYRFDIKEKKFEAHTILGDVPEKRAFHKIIAIGNYIYIFGGKNRFEVFNNIYKFNTITRICKKINASGDIPSPRYNFGICTDGNNIYIIGGENGDIKFNEIYRFNVNTLEWKKIFELDFSIYGHQCILFNNNIYIIFGKQNNTISNDIYKYDIINSNIEKIEPITQLNPNPRMFFSCDLALNNEIITFGGYDENKDYKDLWIFTLEDSKWTHLLDYDLTLYHCELTYDDYSGLVYIYGGTSTNYKYQLYTYMIGIDLHKCIENEIKFYLTNEINNIPDYIRIKYDNVHKLTFNDILNTNNTIIGKTNSLLFPNTEAIRSIQYRYDFNMDIGDKFSDVEVDLVYIEEED